ncbi:ABC transporter permease [Vaginisenegalia massiliensis]|uniref:ABC transporter permease n=1 Tax=Vaginisenegalia massiliensis TaxID=2058294 RepID=UPI0013DDE24E|nr:ABC transporter permease [Vaginisenegalia massiliensis]
MQARLLKYEIRNILGNFFIPLFGIIFPIFMGIIIPASVVEEVPKLIRQEVLNSIILSMSLMIPLCVGFIGYAASYAQENEKQIPLRMKLFGISNKRFIVTKVLGQFCVISVTFLVYFVTMHFVHGFTISNFKGMLIFFAFMYLFTAAFLMISHAIADLIGKFGPTYGLVMCIYFFLLFISGSMGMRYEDFPPFLQKIADQIPLTPFGQHAYDIWRDKLTNYSSLIQTTISLLAVGALLLIWSNYKKKQAI